ncbi:hypothetical protein BU15DRAFT_78764 [Melanogaster broomeanus]|nr:hypothetical protein BU15DRAFT_78764 [Melanogaster broomeanus]
MRTNIERALNDLVVSNKDITLSNTLPAYLREAGFDEISHDALESFEHAMDKYPLLPSKSSRRLREADIGAYGRILSVCINPVKGF